MLHAELLGVEDEIVCLEQPRYVHPLDVVLLNPLPILVLLVRLLVNNPVVLQWGQEPRTLPPQDILDSPDDVGHVVPLGVPPAHHIGVVACPEVEEVLEHRSLVVVEVVHLVVVRQLGAGLQRPCVELPILGVQYGYHQHLVNGLPRHKGGLRNLSLDIQEECPLNALVEAFLLRLVPEYALHELVAWLVALYYLAIAIVLPLLPCVNPLLPGCCVEEGLLDDRTAIGVHHPRGFRNLVCLGCSVPKRGREVLHLNHYRFVRVPLVALEHNSAILLQFPVHPQWIIVDPAVAIVWFYYRANLLDIVSQSVVNVYHSSNFPYILYAKGTGL